MAKAAVIHLTKSVALELGDYGIRSNCICPGIIATPLAAGFAKATDEQLDEMKPRFGRTQVLGRIGDPVDIANAAVWLASDESSYVTGHAQVVDGGAFAGKPWNKQHESMTAQRPIKLYRPDGRRARSAEVDQSNRSSGRPSQIASTYFSIFSTAAV